VRRVVHSLADRGLVERPRSEQVTPTLVGHHRRQLADTSSTSASVSTSTSSDHARRDGNPAVAQQFTNAASIELNEPFAMLATLAGLVATDTNANLQDAINVGQHEVDVMYADYARQVDQAGNPQAANLFREIAGDEKTHQQTFQAALRAS
jgi:rubrerythrin